MIRQRDPTVSWVVVGQRFSANDDVDQARSDLKDAIVELADVTDVDLRLLYAGAKALLMPSRWEGFGFPALEAMACGTPAIVSDTPALVELTRGAGLVVGADDAGGIAAALEQLAGDDSFRRDLVARGLKVASSHDWDTAASRLAQLLEEIPVV
jgi:glycosyltransferase involved in cell wall biosynthesis